MDYKAFNEFCGSLGATSYVVQWSGSHVWKVGDKVFAIGGWGKSGKPAFTFKTSESVFLFLSDEPGLSSGTLFCFSWNESTLSVIVNMAQQKSFLQIYFLCVH